MLKRRLPPASIQVGGASITLSKKIASQIGQVAIESARQAPAQLKDADDPVQDVVEPQHVHWDHLKSVAAQVQDHITAFEQASKALRGDVVATAGHPLVELALHCRASFDAVAMVDDGYDLSRIDEVANTLDDVVAALKDDLTVLKSRQVKHDIACRRVALHAMALDHVSYVDLTPYELPADYEPPDIPRRKNMSEALPDRQAIYRKAAKAYFAAERDQANAAKRRRKMEQRKAMRREIADLWRAAA
jgi:hypothetical protein